MRLLYEGPCSLSLLLEHFVLFGGVGCVSLSSLLLPSCAGFDVDDNDDDDDDDKDARSVEQSVFRSITGITSGSHTKCLPVVTVENKGRYTPGKYFYFIRNQD